MTIEKINSDFSISTRAKDFVINPVWQDMTSLWNFVSGSSEGIGQLIYEHVENFVQNIRDIETCNMHSLYSMAKELNVEQLFSYDLSYPYDLDNLMNILSTGKSITLTSGIILSNESLKEIYSDFGLSVSATLTGQIGSQYIVDLNYITGFMEPSIKSILSINSTIPLSSELSGIALEYQGFMDDIYSNPSIVFDSTTSGIIIDECTHTLRNIAIRASYQRETLKRIAQKHAMIGTNNALEKIIGDYILRSFTKKSDWRLYIEPSGDLKPSSINNAYKMEQSLPSINDINSYFDINVIEYYDNTEYMNISAASPLLCGITGYSTVMNISSGIDISGNLISALVSATIPNYGIGLCGYVITGGNSRYWEGESLANSILYSDHTSGEVSAFYRNLGLSGSLSDSWNLQTTLFDTFSPSSLNRMAVIPELTGTISDAFSGIPLSAVPYSGWLVQPTSLSAIHFKYIGTISGDIPPANYKNQIYPSMAVQPMLWNLIEKVYEDYPQILGSLLFSDQFTSQHLSGRVNISGDLIDSWKFYNHEYIGYQTNYEASNNLDFNEQETPIIDRDGPWNVDALSAYLLSTSSSVSGDLLQYYAPISKEYSLSGIPSNIITQLNTFKTDVINLSGKRIYQYAVDQYDHNYMLYKTDDELITMGTLWMRYRNHPISFPASYGTTNDRDIQQLYIYGGLGLDLDYIFNGHCYDFGFADDIIWILGQNRSGNDIIFVFHNDYVEFPSPINKTLYSCIVNGKDIPRALQITSIDKFVGTYSYSDYLIFVYVTSLPGNSATFKFKHYNKYTKQFEVSPLEDVTITGLQPQYTPVNYSNVWRLAVSEDLVTIAYEYYQLIENPAADFVNGIITIDINKNTLSDNIGDYVVTKWNNFVLNIE